MSLLPRHRFILRILNISLRPEGAAFPSFEPFFLSPGGGGLLPTVDDFLADGGRRALFFAYLRPDDPHVALLSAAGDGAPAGESDVHLAGSRDVGYLACSSDPGLAWDRRRARFAKAGGAEAVDPMASSDPTLTYDVTDGVGGSDSAACAALRSVYLPFLAGEPPPPRAAPGGGRSTESGPDELARCGLRFSDAAGDAIDSVLLHPGNVCGSAPVDLGGAFASDEGARLCEAFLRGWCSHICGYLSRSEERWEADVGSGPGSEVDHWARRRGVLGALKAQLSAQPLRLIVSSVRERSERPGGTHLVPLVNKWEETREKLASALDEANDIAENLSTIQKTVEALDEADSPGRLEEAVSDLMKGMETIYDNSPAYSAPRRMARMFAKIWNALVDAFRRLLSNALGDGAGRPVWESEDDAVADVLLRCSGAAASYRDGYVDFRDGVLLGERARGGVGDGAGLAARDGSVLRSIDAFRGAARAVLRAVSASQRFRAAEACGVPDSGPAAAASYRRARDGIAEAHPDPLGAGPAPADRFRRDAARFEARTAEAEGSMLRSVSASIRACSVEDLRGWYGEVHRSLDGARGRHGEFLAAFDGEVSRRVRSEVMSLASVYERFKDRPPAVRDSPAVCSAVAWARHVRRRLESVVGWMDGPDGGDGAAESALIGDGTHGRLRLALADFENRWYDAWAESSSRASSGMEVPVLAVGSDGTHRVNLDPAVAGAVREARSLGRMGVGVPDGMRLLASREATLKSTRDILGESLGRFRDVMARTRPPLGAVVPATAAFRTVEDGLKRGCAAVRWSDANVREFALRLADDVGVLEGMWRRCDSILREIQGTLTEICRHRIEVLPRGPFEDVDAFVLAREGSIRPSDDFFREKARGVRAAADELASVVAAPARPFEGEVEPPHIADFRSEVYRLARGAVLHSISVALRSLVRCVRSAAGGGGTDPGGAILYLELRISPRVLRVWPPMAEARSAIRGSCGRLLSCLAGAREEVLRGADSGGRSEIEDRGFLADATRACLLIEAALGGAERDMRAFAVENVNRFDWIWQDDAADLEFLGAREGGGGGLRETSGRADGAADVEGALGRVPDQVRFGPFLLVTRTVKDQLLGEYRAKVRRALGGGMEADSRG